MNKKPRILYFDIEKLFSVAAVWQTGKQYINHTQLLDNSRIICIAYKWSDEKKVHCLKWDKDRNDQKMLSTFNKIASQADFLCGHNGENFDVKEIRTAIALRGMADAWCETPVIDTLKDYRKSFRLDSNRLDAVAKKLGYGGKDPMCFQDWIDVYNGSQKALDKMVKYCKKDVILLEKVHKKLDYYVKPVLNRYTESSIWPTFCENNNCDNTTRFIKQGHYTYKQKKYQKFLCKDCYKINMPERLKEQRQ